MPLSSLLLSITGRIRIADHLRLHAFDIKKVFQYHYYAQPPEHPRDIVVCLSIGTSQILVEFKNPVLIED